MATLKNNDFHPTSKVWVFQSDCAILENDRLHSELKNFTRNWKTHGKDVESVFEIIEDRFLVVMVNESHNQVSGCSIDDLMDCVANIEAKLSISLRDRAGFYVLSENIPIYVLLDEYSKLAHEGVINIDLSFYDATIFNKADFNSRWIAPLKSSWVELRYG